MMKSVFQVFLVFSWLYLFHNSFIHKLYTTSNNLTTGGVSTVPNTAAVSSSGEVITVAAHGVDPITVPTENGILAEDPWIKRGQNPLFVNPGVDLGVVTQAVPSSDNRGQNRGSNQGQTPALEILPSSSAAAAVLNLPSAPANIIPNFSNLTVAEVSERGSNNFSNPQASEDHVLEAESDQIASESAVEDDENEDSEEDDDEEEEEDEVCKFNFRIIKKKYVK